MSSKTTKKKESFIPVFIIFLIIFVTILSSLFGYSYALEQEKKETKVQESNIVEENKDINRETEKGEPIKNIDYTFKKKNTKTENLNGKALVLTTYYYMDKILQNNLEEPHEVFALRSELFINNQKIRDSYIDNFYNAEEDLNSYLDSLKESNVKINYLKDTKNYNKYLILTIDYFESSDSKRTSLYLVNDQGQVLKSISGDNSIASMGIKVEEERAKGRVLPNQNGEFILYSNQKFYELDEEEIYYLTRNSTYNEYKVSIENGIVKEEEKNTYPFENVIENTQEEEEN